MAQIKGDRLKILKLIDQHGQLSAAHMLELDESLPGRTIYTLLRRFQEKGFLSSFTKKIPGERNRPRRFYKLTSLGSAALKFALDQDPSDHPEVLQEQLIPPDVLDSLIQYLSHEVDKDPDSDPAILQFFSPDRANELWAKFHKYLDDNLSEELAEPSPEDLLPASIYGNKGYEEFSTPAQIKYQQRLIYALAKEIMQPPEDDHGRLDNSDLAQRFLDAPHRWEAASQLSSEQIVHYVSQMVTEIERGSSLDKVELEVFSDLNKSEYMAVSSKYLSFAFNQDIFQLLSDIAEVLFNKWSSITDVDVPVKPQAETQEQKKRHPN